MKDHANAYHEKVGYWRLFIVSEGQRYEWFVSHSDVFIYGSTPHTEGFGHARHVALDAIHRKSAQAVMRTQHVCCPCVSGETRTIHRQPSAARQPVRTQSERTQMMEKPELRHQLIALLFEVNYNIDANGGKKIGADEWRLAVGYVEGVFAELLDEKDKELVFLTQYLYGVPDAHT